MWRRECAALVRRASRRAFARRLSGDAAGRERPASCAAWRVSADRDDHGSHHSRCRPRGPLLGAAAGAARPAPPPRASLAPSSSSSGRSFAAASSPADAAPGSLASASPGTSAPGGSGAPPTSARAASSSATAAPGRDWSTTTTTRRDQHQSRSLAEWARDADRLDASVDPGAPLDSSARSTKCVITAYGPDRPGLVSSLAKAVFAAKGNVENTRMARLGDDCNVMMLVCFEDATSAERAEFARAAEEIPGLVVKIRSTRSDQRKVRDAQRDTSRWRRVFLHGSDFPGLLYRVTSYLASEGINVELINTDTQHAPFGDDDELFTIDAVIEIPAETSLARFKKSMDRLKNKLGVDIVISDHESHRDD